MPVDLASIVAPDRAAVLVMEMQQGVVGDGAVYPALAEEVAAGGVVEATARLLGAARAAGVPVIHCTAAFRADRAGSSANAPMLAQLRNQPGHLTIGSRGAAIVPQLGPEPGDLIESRIHGVSPFGGTSLDVTLRNLGTSTVVAAGVSLNLGIVGLAIEAVNLGYRVVVATDAVAGTPRDYAAEVLRRTVSLVATRATVEEIAAAWPARRTA